MKLTIETCMKLTETQANIVGHMGYMAFKLWNTLNYERLHYRELGFETMPSCRDQKMQHKDDLFARSLPSQTAQDVANSLDWAWKSYFTLLKT